MANDTRNRRLQRELQQLITNALPGINVNDDSSTSLETYEKIRIKFVLIFLAFIASYNHKSFVYFTHELICLDIL